MKPRFFWLYSDGETVKVISWEDWCNIVNKEWQSDGNTRLLCRVHDNEVYIRKGRNYIGIQKSQLKAILE